MATITGGQGNYVLNNVPPADVVQVTVNQPLPPPTGPNQVLVITGGNAPPTSLPTGYTAIVYIDAAGTLVTLTGNISFTAPTGGPSGLPFLGKMAFAATDPALPTITITGGAGAETITGGINPAVIYGGSGPDSLVGGTGPTTIFGGTGFDTIRGGSGTSQIFAGSAPETIFGGSGPTTIFGASADSITGGSGSAVIHAGPASVVKGGSGAETIFGASADTITGGSGPTKIHSAGNESITGGSGPTTITGGSGDTILGGAGKTKMHGEAGNQYLTGGLFAGAGNTTIFGGSSDAIQGGFGKNKINLGSSGDQTIADFDTHGHSTARETVTGFDQTSGDTIAFPHATEARINEVLGSATQVSVRGIDSTQITLLDGTKLTLVGVTQIDKSFFS